MAKAATDEQVQLRRRARRRLVGAIALVTLIAVVLPWILESEPRSSEQEISIQIPSPDAGTFSTRVPPGKAAATGKPAAKQDAQPAEEATASAPPVASGVLQSEQDSVLAPPATKSVPAKDRPPAAKEAKSPAPEIRKKTPEARDEPSDGKQFVVQITALADATKAESLQKALAAKGLNSYTEVVQTGSGEVTRVRVGPFASREIAEHARTKLKALGYDGNVAPR